MRATSSILPRFTAADLGLWLIESRVFGEVLQAFQHQSTPEARSRLRDLEQPASQDTIAIIPIHGAMVKEHSFFSWFFGGVSTVDVQDMLGEAVRDPSIKGILLHIDSPGGQVAGTDALASAIRETNKTKPVWAHIDDLGASAAMWIASQSSHITANPTAEVGSIGTMAVITDTSAIAEEIGAKVHVISTGALKGFGVPGTALSEEGLANLKDRVYAINDHFLEALSTGRGMSAEQLAAVSDGRVMIAHEGKQAGLIDEVAHFPQALQAFAKDLNKRRFAMGNPLAAALRTLSRFGLKAVADDHAEAAKDEEEPSEGEEKDQPTEAAKAPTPQPVVAAQPTYTDGVQYAAAILEKCQMVGMLDQAQSLIAQGLSVEEATSRLQAMRVARDAAVQSHLLPDAQAKAQQPVIDFQAIYRQRNAHIYGA